MVLVSALAAWMFLEIADEVMDEETTRFDEAVLLALRAPDDLADPIGPLWFEEAARDITALGSTAVLLIVVAGMTIFLLMTSKRRAALIFALATFSGIGLSQSLKGAYDRARPDLVAHKMHVLTKSFPSGHSLLATLVYMSIGTLLASTQPKYKVKVFVLVGSALVAVLVGLSRLYLGVHWPTDVAAGWCAGLVWALLWWLVSLMVLPREETEDSGMET